MRRPKHLPFFAAFALLLSGAKDPETTKPKRAPIRAQPAPGEPAPSEPDEPKPAPKPAPSKPPPSEPAPSKAAPSKELPSEPVPSKPALPPPPSKPAPSEPVPSEPGSGAADAAQKKSPPFGDAPKQADQPKPAERVWNVKSGDFAFIVMMKPGIPDPDQLTEVIITANSTPKTPHPRYGNRVPIDDATITVEMSSPGGEVVGRYLAHAMPLSSGRYGVHLTPAQHGIYNLSIRGMTADGKGLSADVKLPVKIWPLPAELQGSGDAEKGGRRPIKG